MLWTDLYEIMLQYSLLSSQELEQLPQQTWYSLPNYPRFSGPTVPIDGRQFFIYSPSTILKLGTDDGEANMTALAHSMLGPLVPRVNCVVTLPIITPNALTPNRTQQGLILTRLQGKPLVEIWHRLSPAQRETVKADLYRLLVRMRKHHFHYYGRPTRQPYVFLTEFGAQMHASCTSRLEWDDSRVRALKAATTDAERAVTLERVQRSITGAMGWCNPVLTHGDLSDRNILVDPNTLKVTGLLDWEAANIMPAYFEYVAARLSGAHRSEWRKDLLDVLRSVLRSECDAIDVDRGNQRYKITLAAWDAVVDVERVAQGYTDECTWTFETGLPDVPQKTGSAS